MNMKMKITLRNNADARTIRPGSWPGLKSAKHNGGKTVFAQVCDLDLAIASMDADPRVAAYELGVGVVVKSAKTSYDC